jgi:putative transposase
LREAERSLGEGRIPEAAKAIEISEQTYHRWRNQYGGMKADDAKRLKGLERENRRLKAIVADQALENRALKEISPGETGEPSPSASGGRDGSRPSRCQRALGLQGGRAASLDRALRAEAG